MCFSPPVERIVDIRLTSTKSNLRGAFNFTINMFTTDNDGHKIELRNFPNGYSVRVVRKEDIIDCLDKNVTDPEVVLEVIKHCELCAANYISNGQWASIPFMGSLKINIARKLARDKVKEFNAGAKAYIDKENVQEKNRYYLFKKALNSDIRDRIRADSYYNYIVSLGIPRYTKQYFRVYRKCGKYAARLYIFFRMNIAAIDNRWEYEYSDELAKLDNNE